MRLIHFLLWIPLIAIAFANAALRELLLSRYFDQLHAQQLSTLSLIILSAVYIKLVLNSLRIKDQRQALWIGFCWLVLTVLFELTLGRILNRSWKELVQDYNLLAGHIWPLFLFSLLFLPYILFRYQSWKPR